MPKRTRSKPVARLIFWWECAGARFHGPTPHNSPPIASYAICATNPACNFGIFQAVVQMKNMQSSMDQAQRLQIRNMLFWWWIMWLIQHVYYRQITDREWESSTAALSDSIKTLLPINKVTVHCWMFMLTLAKVEGSASKDKPPALRLQGQRNVQSQSVIATRKQLVLFLLRWYNL